MTAPTQVTHTELNSAANAVVALYVGDRGLVKRTIDWSEAIGLDYENQYWSIAASGLAARATAISKELFVPIPITDGGVTLTRFRVRVKRGGSNNFSTVLYRVSLSTGVHTAVATLTTSADLYRTLDSGVIAVSPPASSALLIHAVATNIGDEFAGAILDYTVAP